MTSILFICHGNICRSTMAQSIMQHLVDEAALSSQFAIDSAAVSSEELGNPVYPCTRDELKRRGVSVVEHYARKITYPWYSRDFGRTFDEIYAGCVALLSKIVCDHQA